MIITFGLALSSLCPDVCWSIAGDDYENCLWDRDDILKPTREQIAAEQVRLQAIEDARVQAEEKDASAAKAAAEAKLAKLGLTTDDLKALLG
jgi:hypothetical protein